MSIESAEHRAARIDVIRIAARYMADTDDDFYTTLGKWLKADALVLEVSGHRAGVRAHEIAEAYLRSRDRLHGRTS